MYQKVDGQPNLLRHVETGRILRLNEFRHDVHIGGLEGVWVPAGFVDRVVVVSPKPFTGCLVRLRDCEVLDKFAGVDLVVTPEDACRTASKLVGRLQMDFYPHATAWRFDASPGDIPSEARIQVIGRFLFDEEISSR